MEVYPNVLWLKSKGCNVYLLKANETYLIDSGTPNSSKLLLSQIKKLNIKLDGILITHAHFDHVGSAYELQKAFNCPVYIHRLDYPYLTGERRFNYEGVLGKIAKFVEKFSKFKVPEKIVAIDESNLDLQISVIHTPGHTPGSVCYLYDNVLFCGDLIRNNKKYYFFGKHEIGLSPKAFCSNYKDYLSSVRKILDFDFNTLLPGHGLPIYNAKDKLKFLNLY